MSDQPRRSLRPESDDDRDFLKKLFFTARQRAYVAANLSAADQEKLLAHQFEAQRADYYNKYPGATFDVVLLNDAPIGRFYVHRRKEEFCLMEMSIMPNHRNQGIGTALINELCSEAEAAGKSVVLHVEHWNPEARRLYLRLGFEDEEDIQTHIRMRWHPPTSAP